MLLAKASLDPFLLVAAVAAASKDFDELVLVPAVLVLLEAPQADNRILLGHALIAFIGTVALLQNASA